MAKKRPAAVVNSARGLPEIAMVLLLLCATLVAYSPALNGELLWDDDGHVTKPALQSLHGLWRIWFELGATQQYYPMLHSAFWIEHRLWGDSVLGYHLTNVFLHVTAACFVVWIMRRISLPGAWFAGFLFALHPVCVEAVAWIAEQKSTLSAVFYLGAAIAYLRFDQTRRKTLYFIALGLFLLALLSKTVTATLPAALLLVFWWQRKRLSWKRDVRLLLPWFALGAAAGLFTAWVERRYVAAEGPDFELSLLQRCLLASRAIFFYLGKLVWPVNLTFTYPRWKLDPAAWWQYGFPLSVLALVAGLWLLSRRRRGPLAAFLFFAGTLFPALGFFNVYPFIYSYVADHFQYLASLGIIVPIAFGQTLAAGRIPVGDREIARWMAPLARVVLLAALGALTWRQSGIYQDAETLYRATLLRNPGSWMAHNNLGSILAKTGRAPEAIAEFEAALRIRPEYAEAHNNLANVLEEIPGRLPEAVTHLQAALRGRPGEAAIHSNLGSVLAKIPGRLPDAVGEYEAALRIDPGLVYAHNNLGIALTQIPGRLPEGVSHLRTALRLAPNIAEVHNSLANALAQVPGGLPEEISEYEAALQIKPDYEEAHFNLGLALAAIPGRLPEAIMHFEAAVQIDPDNLQAQYNLAIALLKVPGRLPEATAHLEAVSRLRPDLVVVRQMLERLHAAQR
jgi:tetratricopeptide (TPR) repeat protein